MGYRKFPALLFYLLATNLGTQVGAVYSLVREHSGASFFDRWDFYGNTDDTTWGNVTYLDREDAMSRGLAYVNSAGNAIMRVDNTTYISPAPEVYRASIKITSQDTYGSGNLIVIDLRHIPYGCSVWPSFWTRGTGVVWPNGGEIDIIEAINLMNDNQYVVHTSPGCTLDPSAEHTGNVLDTSCSQTTGCVVAESRANSYGAGFAQAGGGVYATQLDTSGIYMWFWSRSDVPADIRSATLDPSTWGMPSAAYTNATCDYAEYFTPQQLLFTTTLCGSWAGTPGAYPSTCLTPTNSCVNDNIIGPGHPTYNNAYWEISYLRIYGEAARMSNMGQSVTQGSITGPAYYIPCTIYTILIVHWFYTLSRYHQSLSMQL